MHLRIGPGPFQLEELHQLAAPRLDPDRSGQGFLQEQRGHDLHDGFSVQLVKLVAHHVLADPRLEVGDRVVPAYRMLARNNSVCPGTNHVWSVAGNDVLITLAFCGDHGCQRRWRPAHQSAEVLSPRELGIYRAAG